MARRKGKKRKEPAVAGAVAEEEVEYVVESVQDSRLVDGATEYLIKWDGWEAPTWESEENCNGCRGAIAEYVRNKAKEHTEAGAKEGKAGAVNMDGANGDEAEDEDAESETDVSDTDEDEEDEDEEDEEEKERRITQLGSYLDEAIISFAKTEECVPLGRREWRCRSSFIVAQRPTWMDASMPLADQEQRQELLARLSEQNYACYALSQGQKVHYTDVPRLGRSTPDVGGASPDVIRRYVLPEGYTPEELQMSDAIIDTVSTRLVDPGPSSSYREGPSSTSRVTPAILQAACSSSVKAMFFHAGWPKDSHEALAKAIKSCRLRCLALSNCAFSKVLASAVPRGCRSLRLHQLDGLTDELLAIAVKRCANHLRCLMVETPPASMGGAAPESLPGPATVAALQRCTTIEFISLSGPTDIAQVAASLVGDPSTIERQPMDSLQVLHIGVGSSDPRSCPAATHFPSITPALNAVLATCDSMFCVDGLALIPQPLNKTRKVAAAQVDALQLKPDCALVMNHVSLPVEALRQLNGQDGGMTALHTLVITKAAALVKNKPDTTRKSKVAKSSDELELDRASSRTLAALGKSVRAVQVCTPLADGDLEELAYAMPLVEQLSLRGALQAREDGSDFDDALQHLAKCCPNLQVLDLSNCGGGDASQAFTERGLRHAVREMKSLHSLYLCKSGRDFDYENVTAGVQSGVRVYHDYEERCRRHNLLYCCVADDDY